MPPEEKASCNPELTFFSSPRDLVVSRLLPQIRRRVQDPRLHQIFPERRRKGIPFSSRRRLKRNQLDTKGTSVLIKSVE